MQGFHGYARVGAVRVRVGRAHPPPDRAEIVGGLLGRHARAEPRDRAEEALRAVRAPRIGRGGIRRHHVHVADEGHEVRANHPRDAEGLAVEHDRLANRVRSGAKPTLPEAVTDHGDGPVLVSGLERTAELDGCAGDLEVVRRYAHALEPLGVTVARQVHAPAEAGYDSLDGTGLRLEVGKVGQRKRLPVGAWPDDRERDETCRIPERQRAKEDAVDEREHRAVRANGQRQDRDHAGGKQRLLAKATDGLHHLEECHVCRLRCS